MPLSGIRSLIGIRGLLYTLFGTLMLSTLWVTSLTRLSDRPNAIPLLTEAGANILNPFLAKQGLGISQQTCKTLEASAKANPKASLSFSSVLKVHVPGSKIIGKNCDDVVRLVYNQVATTYYDHGPEAVFAIPTELKAALPSFAFFDLNKSAAAPGGPTVSQLPNFLQPFLVFVGLTPETFTIGGHQRLLSLLPFFWLAVVVLGGLTLLVTRNEQKLANLAKGVLHSTWPVVGVLVLLWVLSFVYSTTFSPYLGVLGLVTFAFLPIYGVALVVAVVGLVLMKVFEDRQPRGKERQPALATTISTLAGRSAPAPMYMPPPPPGAAAPPLAAPPQEPPQEPPATNAGR